MQGLIEEYGEIFGDGPEGLERGLCATEVGREYARSLNAKDLQTIQVILEASKEYWISPLGSDRLCLDPWHAF